jgi:hypothetical protein
MAASAQPKQETTSQLEPRLGVGRGSWLEPARLRTTTGPLGPRIHPQRLCSIGRGVFCFDSMEGLLVISLCDAFVSEDHQLHTGRWMSVS